MTHRVLKSHKSKMGVIYIYNHENNVPSRLSPQWIDCNSCTWEHDVRLHIAVTNEPKRAQPKSAHVPKSRLQPIFRIKNPWFSLIFSLKFCLFFPDFSWFLYYSYSQNSLLTPQANSFYLWTSCFPTAQAFWSPKHYVRRRSGKNMLLYLAMFIKSDW